MNILHSAIAATLALTSAAVIAAAPKLSTTETVTINAPADVVWKNVKDFDSLNKWHPAVAKDEIVSGSNNKPGAVRLLTLKDGGTIKEELLKMNESGKSYQYRIIEGVLPVSNYASTVTVKPSGKDKSLVTWSGKYQRKDTGANPGEKENDKTATSTISAVYRAGLDNLKSMTETAK